MDLLNITRTQLEIQIIEPYQSGKMFRLKLRLFEPSEVAKFLIKTTPREVAELSAIYGEKFVNGADVTDQFLKKTREKETIEDTKSTSKDVFIVHGKDHAPMKELKTMLYEFGLNPIVLHEQPSGSRTIVEKLEKYSDVGYAFVILTPDDIGTLNEDDMKVFHSIIEETIDVAEQVWHMKGIPPHFGMPSTRVELELADGISRISGEENKISPEKTKETRRKLNAVCSSFKHRARQNVVLEFGYFVGLLNRDRVCCLYRGNVELPSDMQGIVYIPFKNSVNEVKEMISKELAEAGYSVSSRKEEAKEDHANDMKKLRDDVEMLKRRGSYPL